MRVRSALAIAAFIGLAAGCADLFGFHDLRTPDDDASMDATSDTIDQPDVDNCPHALYPNPPTSTGAGTPNGYSIAVRHIHFTTSTDGGVDTIGYDLDHRCTVDQASASCQGPVVVDGPGGVDNASIQLLNTLVALEPSLTTSLSDDALNGSIDAGDYTILVSMFGLVNATNQTSPQSLQVGVQASPGVENPPPAWQGTDRWLVSVDDVFGGDAGSNLPLVTVAAYITNGVLVAPSPGAITIHVVLPPGSLSGPLAVTLRDAVLTARLVARSDQNFDLADGIIAGRWDANDMLAAISGLTINGGALCDYLGGAVWGAVTSHVCDARDINATGNDDGGAPCNGVSVAIGFDGVAAQIAGSPSPFPETTTPCGDAGMCE
jgi:hypothetical protein